MNISALTCLNVNQLKNTFILLVFLVSFPTHLLFSQDKAANNLDLNDYDIKTLVTHPIFDTHFISREHPEGAENTLGDQLGRDFVVFSINNPDKPYPISFKNDGKENEDWFGWREKVLAPVTGTVKEITINPKTNKPGNFGEPPASSITIKRADGVHVVVVHVREIKVNEGDVVEAGEYIARVGNNGRSYNPHIHLGAWYKDQPLQIQVDLEKLGE